MTPRREYTLSSDNETSVNELTSKKNLDNEHDNERRITSNFLDMFYLDNKLFTEEFSWWASKMLVRPTYYRENIKYLEIWIKQAVWKLDREK